MVRQNWSKSISRSAFTITELLVVISIIGLLVSITIPAIQMTRGAARRMSCRNNLHQVGLALESHSSSTGRFPDAHTLFRDLLPSFGEELIHTNSVSGLYEAGTIPRPSFATFRCPSDPLAPSLLVPDTLSYAANVGTGNQVAGLDGFITTTGDRFVIGYPPTPSNSSNELTRPRDITDGLSQTVAIAEMLPSSVESLHREMPVGDVRRIDWVLPQPLVRPSEFRELLDHCAAIRTSPTSAEKSGSTRGWFWSNATLSFGLATYHHALAPNSPSCLNGGATYAIFAAGSAHAGGVHALWGDGHVTFISDAIDINLWHDLGTRAGSE